MDSPEPVLTTIRYATWVRQSLEKQSREGANDTRWLTHMPEVTSLLDSRLALGIKAPISAHSVFGEELGRLFQLDQEWVSQQLPTIFPDSPEAKELFNGAWTSYLFHWNPGVPLFELLRGQYMTAIHVRASLRRRLALPRTYGAFGRTLDVHVLLRKAEPRR